MALISRLLSTNLLRSLGSSLGNSFNTWGASLAHPIQCSTSAALNLVRYKSSDNSSRPRCAKDALPRCSPLNLQKKGDCKKKMTKSMWENPDCCIDPCKNYLPRLDDLYYKPSDKDKRIYTRTWNECPQIIIRPKKICCFDKIIYPPIERRKKGECPKTACPIPSHEARGACNIFRSRGCTKLRLPGCRGARDPPRCFEIKSPSNCKKICAPYPSYSECSKPKPKPLRPIECHCLYVGPACRMKR